MFQTENKGEYELLLFRETAKYYEQVYLKLKIQQTVDKELVNLCFHNIETLLNLELNEKKNLDLDIRTSLMFVQKQLMNLLSTDTAENDQLTDKTGKKAINAVTPKVKGLSEIAGLNEIKNILITLIVLPIHQPQLYQNQKVSNSILFYGPPGTGKTRMAHAIAAEACAEFYSVCCSDIMSYYVGNTEKMIKQVFHTIKKVQKCVVLFMDEIDSLCQSRKANDSDWSRRLKTELMCQLSDMEDCPNKYFICATNCPWDLDTAIIRRFQRRIYVPLPNKEERKELIKYLIKDISIEITSEMFTQILEKTEGYSCSDVKDVILHAINIPIQELSNTLVWEHIGDDKFKPSDCQNIQNVVVCNIIQMPAGSIQSRRVEVLDIIKSLEIVKATVPAADLVMYENFSKMC